MKKASFSGSVVHVCLAASLCLIQRQFEKWLQFYEATEIFTTNIKKIKT